MPAIYQSHADRPTQMLERMAREYAYQLETGEYNLAPMRRVGEARYIAELREGLAECQAILTTRAGAAS